MGLVGSKARGGLISCRITMSELGLVIVDKHALSWPTTPAVGESDPEVIRDDSWGSSAGSVSVGKSSQDDCRLIRYRH